MTDVIIVWSTRLSHSFTLLKPFDGMRCHLAGKLMQPHVTLCSIRALVSDQKLRRRQDLVQEGGEQN